MMICHLLVTLPVLINIKLTQRGVVFKMAVRTYYLFLRMRRLIYFIPYVLYIFPGAPL